jgi:hypothetical protein
MCLPPTPQDACDKYETNWEWMKRSGNKCWGMGAANKIPCLRCGVRQDMHFTKWVGDVNDKDSSDYRPSS